jgi:hypothetical protein
MSERLSNRRSASKASGVALSAAKVEPDDGTATPGCRKGVKGSGGGGEDASGSSAFAAPSSARSCALSCATKRPSKRAFAGSDCDEFVSVLDGASSVPSSAAASDGFACGSSKSGFGPRRAALSGVCLALRGRNGPIARGRSPTNLSRSSPSRRKALLLESLTLIAWALMRFDAIASGFPQLDCAMSQCAVALLRFAGIPRFLWR